MSRAKTFVLLLMNLWRTVRGATLRELVDFERDAANVHSRFYGKAGYDYLGLFETGVTDATDPAVRARFEGFTHGYLYRVDASNPREAQDRIEGRPVPEDIQRITERRRVLNDASGPRGQLWLIPTSGSNTKIRNRGAFLSTDSEGGYIGIVPDVSTSGETREAGMVRNKRKDSGELKRLAEALVSKEREVGGRFVGLFSAAGVVEGLAWFFVATIEGTSPPLGIFKQVERLSGRSSGGRLLVKLSPLLVMG